MKVAVKVNGVQNNVVRTKTVWHWKKKKKIHTVLEHGGE